MSQTKSGRLFSRSKHASVRARYLDYLQRDVKQRLAESIHAARFLDIGVNEKLNATVPWHYKALDGEQQFSNFDLAFEHFRGRVLLLGPPGSGKTTTLLNLVLKLVEDAQQNQALDIPLLLNLSKFGSVSPRRVTEQLKWLRRRKDPTEENPARIFEQWLVQMLVEMPVEGLNRQVAQQWVESSSMALMLDGLDELNDAYLLKLAEILNQTYFHEHPDQVVVVCSRVIEYQPLQENKEARLRLNGAVILQPPTPEQIDEYLEAAQALALRDALRGDNALYEMAQTPLTLSMMTLAYGGEAPTDIPQDLPFLERRRMLLDTYVERMVQRTARREKGVPFDLNSDNDETPQYSLKKTNHYLGWLAIKLSERSRTLFPLARFYSFLSKDYPEGDTRAIALKYGVAMIGIWLVAVITNAGLLLPYGWRLIWAVGALPLLAPLAVLLLATEEISTNTVIGDSILEFFRLATSSTCALLSLLVVTLSMGVLLDHKIRAEVTMTILVAFLIVGLLVYDSVKEGREWNYLRSFLGPFLLVLALLLLLTATSYFVSNSVQIASYVLAASCALTVLVVLRRYGVLSGKLWWIFAITAVGAWTSLLSLAILFERAGARVLPALSFAMMLWLGILTATDSWKGTTLTFAAVVVLANVLVGPNLATIAMVAVLLIHLTVGKKEAWVLFEWLVLNPILRLTLAIINSITFRYKTFLKYATNTMLIKEVGIEYEFGHRMLRDHFAVRELLPQLWVTEGEQRLKIIQRLSRQGDSSFDALASLVTNSDGRVRSAAIEGLGRIAIPKVLPIMQDRIENDPDEEVRVSVVRSMNKFGTDEKKVYDRAIKDPSPRVRRATIVASSDDKITLLGLQDEADIVFRQTLIQISRGRYSYLLRDLLTASLLERLIQAISDADSKVSEGAARAIEGFYWLPPSPAAEGTHLILDSAVAALISKSSDKDAGVRKAMISALSEIADEEMSRAQHERIKIALMSALRDRNREVRKVAIPGLGRLEDPEILTFLRKELNKGGVGQRRLILTQLGIKRDRVSITAIVKYFDKPPVRYAAAQAMARIGPFSDSDGYSVVPQLVELLNDPGRRAAAIMALVELRVKSVIPKLRELLVQPPKQFWLHRVLRRETDVRPFAAIALGRLGDIDSVPTLLRFSSSFQTQQLFAQARALGLLLPADSVEQRVVKALANLPLREQEALRRKLFNLKFAKVDGSQSLPAQLANILLESSWRNLYSIWREDEDHQFFVF